MLEILLKIRGHFPCIFPVSRTHSWKYLASCRASWLCLWSSQKALTTLSSSANKDPAHSDALGECLAALLRHNSIVTRSIKTIIAIAHISPGLSPEPKPVMSTNALIRSSQFAGVFTEVISHWIYLIVFWVLSRSAISRLNFNNFINGLSRDICKQAGLFWELLKFKQSITEASNFGTFTRFTILKLLLNKTNSPILG